MNEQPPTRRRWFRFSLRTLFVVVTVFAVWLGWELDFIRDCNAVRQTIADRGGTVHMAIYDLDLGFDLSHPDLLPIPLWRQWLGDQPVSQVSLPRGATERDLTDGRNQFPEALVVYGFYEDAVRELQKKRTANRTAVPSPATH